MRPKELVIAILVFGAFGLLMFVTAPVAGDFSWSDAPRHALNGIFMKDFIAGLPLDNPRQYAINYYLRYPALTILFYPPLFSTVLAGSYALFGFSHAVAQATVTFFHVFLAIGVNLLARRWLSPVYAVAAALMLVAAPEIALWGRQVMLDIPAYAWLVFMALAFVRYLDDYRPRYLYLTVFLFLAALYTKQTPVFVAGALVFGVFAARGVSALRDRHIWIAALVFAVLAVPLTVLHLKFGQVNTASMMGSLRPDVSRASLEAWTYYATQLPGQLGWPTVLLAATYLAGAALRPSWRLPRSHMVFLLSWFLLGYAFFSFIMVHDPRLDLMALLPLPIFAALAATHLLDPLRPRVGPALVLAVGTSSLLWSVFAYPIQYVGGYAEAARFVMDRAPKNGAVLFSGNRDGSFIFNMRAGNRTDVSIIRADKLLLQVGIERERGVRDLGVGSIQIEDMVRRYAVRYVVVETGFWADLPSMRSLYDLLGDRSRFKPVHRIVPVANFNNTDHELMVYEYLGEIASRPAPLGLQLFGTGQKIEQE